MIDKSVVKRLANQTGMAKGDYVVQYPRASDLLRFAEAMIAHFLQETGQYVTNDASREAVISEAVAREREECARLCEQVGNEWSQRNSRWQHHTGAGIGALKCVELIRARGSSLPPE